MKRQQQSGLRFQPARGVQQTDFPVGKKQPLSIERLAHDGRGIAFHAGRTWFVSGAMPGEQIVARVLSVRNKIVEAQVVEVQQACSNRQQPFCAVAGRCGGCTLQHMPINEQREFKQAYIAEQMQRAGVEVGEWFATLQGSERGYRRRTRIAVKPNKQGQLQVGFRALASQQIVETTQCPILVEPLQKLYAELVPFIKTLMHTRAIGHLELFYGNQPALLVRLTQALNNEDQQRLRDFCQQQHTQLWWQTQAEPYPDNEGDTLYYELQPYDLQIDYQPGDFVQVNAEVNLAMVQQALAWMDLHSDDQVLDLFCGLGNFSLPVARTVASVVAVEGVESMVKRAQHTAKRQGLQHVEFHHFDLSQSLSQAAWMQQKFSVVVLDPPREGAAQAVEQLTKVAAKKILYVSCNPATLARDAAVLQAQGYQLQRLAALDMFSQTGHVEAMALFVRQSLSRY